MKGNLSALPFPKITEEQDEQFTALVDRALSGDSKVQDKIDEMIFALYDLNTEEIDLITE